MSSWNHSFTRLFTLLRAALWRKIDLWDLLRFCGTAGVDKKKGFLAWFEPKTKHECPGCGGYMTVFPIKNPGHGLYGRYYTHTCSICGANSAACYWNAPGHKIK
jgi:hypothetical protein